MKRLLFISLAALVSTLGLLASPHEANALSVPPHETSRISAARCTMAKRRITTMSDTMKTVSERRTTVYTNMREKALARMAVLQQKGYDTTKLKTDLETLNAQIINHRTLAKTLYDTLNAAKNITCGDDNSVLASTLTDARGQLKAVRESSRAIHQTLRTLIVPDIRAAAAWLKDN